MLFERDQKFALLRCDQCRGTGLIYWGTCSLCRGMAQGRMSRGRWLFWRYPLDRYHIAFDHAKKLVNKIRKIVVFILGLNFLFWAGFVAYRYLIITPKYGYVRPDFSVSQLPGSVDALFWLGIAALSYWWYRVVVERAKLMPIAHKENFNEELEEAVEALPTSWSDVLAMPKYKRTSIISSFTPEAIETLGVAYTVADQFAYNKVNSFHLLYALFTTPKIRILFIRMGVAVDQIQERLRPLFANNNSTTGGTHTAPVVSEELFDIFFKAYEEAYRAENDYVYSMDLLLCAVRASEQIQDILYDFSIDKNKLLNVVAWARIKDRLYRQYADLKEASRHRSKYGMDRAMTAVATPYLNHLSDDLTLLAQLGHTMTCVARDNEIRQVFQVIDGGQQSVLLVGDYGVGKKSIVEGIAEKMVEERVPARLRDKRMVRLNLSSLLAGATPSEAVERLQSIMYEIERAGNIILCIHNIHELLSVSAGGRAGVDVVSTLADYLSSGRFLTIATTTTESYAQMIANSKLSTVMTKVMVPEMNENQAIQVLESKVGYLEYKHDIFYTYDALARTVELSKKFVREVTLPGSALEIMSEAGARVRSQRGKDSLVTKDDVGEVIAEKTHVPLTSVTADESSKLMRLETTMHERVVGQDEAVSLVANALRRARADIRSKARPIANFLFLGPTGVGKTELAKTMAEVYFGGEDRMVRFDMSEFQDKQSLSRLIGLLGEKGTGLLTEAVRQNPFALLLLDEIEKADKDVINIFLQVMDDGRLTDSTGRVVDFTNVIIIATSNAGTGFVQDQMRQGLSSDIIKDRLLHGELKQHFKPEFLNRFDGIVLFKPLALGDIKQITHLMLLRISKELEAKGITLEVRDVALEFLASAGYDPEYGARPLRRVLQERVENKLAELLLTGALHRRDTVVIGQGGEITLRT